MPREIYTVGLDLGQSSDPTAIAVLRRTDADPPTFSVPHLERLPLNTSYPGIVQHTRRLMSRLPRGTELCIDFTGVGRPVFDMFQAAGLSPIGVSITGGDSASSEGLVHHVAKIILISRLQAVLHDGRLKVLRTLPEASVLAAELQDFRAEVSDTGMWRFGARSGKHDDLVLALAIALWRSHGSTTLLGWVKHYARLAANRGRIDPPADAPPSRFIGDAVAPLAPAAPAGVTMKIAMAPGTAALELKASSRRYEAGADGIIRNVLATDVVVLERLGATLLGD